MANATSDPLHIRTLAIKKKSVIVEQQDDRRWVRNEQFS